MADWRPAEARQPRGEPRENRKAPAESYEAYLASAFRPWADQLIERAGLSAGERVLDVACGTGIVARRAAPRVGASGTVVGLDLNAGMLSVAQSRVGRPPAGD